jgi:hypothetical protein
VALHASLRLPVKLPGHKGLLLIGLLMVGRLASQRRWASSTASASAGVIALLPALGFKDILDPLTFFLAGIVIDIGFGRSDRASSSVWTIALLGAVAHLTKPLTRLIYLPLTGTPYPSLVNGIAYPIALHALFGATGAVAAVFLLRLIRRPRKADESP